MKYGPSTSRPARWACCWKAPWAWATIWFTGRTANSAGPASLKARSTASIPGQDRVVSAEGLPFINGIGFSKEGRLFASQVFAADALWELDPAGKTKPKKILDAPGWLNAFDFGPDGKLYGPLMRMDKRCIARIDLATGRIETIATDFKKGPFTVDSPNAVKFDEQGRLYGIQASTGLVYRVDIDTGKIEDLAQFDPGLDNLVISKDGKIYITNMIHNSIYEVDIATKKTRTLVEGRLATPQGLCVRNTKDGDTLYVADTWSLKKVDTKTGALEILWESHFQFPINVQLDGDTAIITGWLEALSEFDVTTARNVRVLHGFGGASKTLRLADGSLIVANIVTGEIIKVTGAKGQERAVLVKGLGLPSSIELAGPNAIYVTEAGPGLLSRIDLATGEKKAVAMGLAKPVNMAVCPDGKLLVVEMDKKRLVRIDPSTGEINPLVGDLPIGLKSWGPPVWTHPGVAVSPSGAIYLSSDIENSLYKVTPAK